MWAVLASMMRCEGEDMASTRVTGVAVRAGDSGAEEVVMKDEMEGGVGLGASEGGGCCCCTGVDASGAVATFAVK